MDWFKHKTASHDDPDICDAEDIYGDSAYAIFFKLCELYGQEFTHLDDGFLNVSQTFLRRKLRKSWAKVEQVLNFYQERNRICYKVEYGRIKIRMPKFIDLASNWVKRNESQPTEAPTEAPTAKEVEVEVEEKKKEPPIVPLWKTDMREYLQSHDTEFKGLLEDSEWMVQRREFHPNLDIKKSMVKAATDYWRKEVGWKKKKRTSIKVIDWKQTYTNALSQKMNQVWLPRDTNKQSGYSDPPTKEFSIND